MSEEDGLLERCLEKIENSLGTCIVNGSKVFGVEDLMHTAIFDDDEDLTSGDPEQSRRLKASAGQLLKIIRCCGYILLFLSFVHFAQSCYCLYSIDLADFTRYTKKSAYAKEMYWYSCQVERMKVFHGFCLLLISGFIARMTARGGNMLTDTHYKKMLMLTIGLSVVFALPFLYVVYASYRSAGQTGTFGNRTYDNVHYNALLNFADWLVMMLLRTDMGIWGLCLSIVVVAQIYILLFVLHWCAL